MKWLFGDASRGEIFQVGFEWVAVGIRRNAISNYTVIIPFECRFYELFVTIRKEKRKERRKSLSRKKKVRGSSTKYNSDRERRGETRSLRANCGNNRRFTPPPPLLLPEGRQVPLEIVVDENVRPALS